MDRLVGCVRAYSGSELGRGVLVIFDWPRLVVYRFAIYSARSTHRIVDELCHEPCAKPLRSLLDWCRGELHQLVSLLQQILNGFQADKLARVPRPGGGGEGGGNGGGEGGGTGGREGSGGQGGGGDGGGGFLAI